MLEARPFKPSDEKFVRQWKIDTPVLLPRHAIIARSRIVGFEERLRTYVEWRAVTIERHGDTVKPVSCSGWGLKRVRFQNREISVAYMIDGFRSAAAKDVYLDPGSFGLPTRGWKQHIDGEQAICCKTSTLSTIEMSSIVNQGYIALGSFVRFNWCDTQHTQLKQRIHDFDMYLFPPCDTQILQYWDKAFEQSHALYPIEPLELVSIQSYIESIVLVSAENWVCVTRWGDLESFCIPHSDFDKTRKSGGRAMKLNHEVLCVFGSSSPPADNPVVAQLMCEVVRIAGQRAIREGSDYLTAVVDHGYVSALEPLFKDVRAPSLRYANGLKIYDLSFPPNPQMPTFWDPRDLGPVYCFAECMSGVVPVKIMRTRQTSLTQEALLFVFGETMAKPQGEVLPKKVKRVKWQSRLPATIVGRGEGEAAAVVVPADPPPAYFVVLVSVVFLYVIACIAAATSCVLQWPGVISKENAFVVFNSAICAGRRVGSLAVALYSLYSCVKKKVEVTPDTALAVVSLIFVGVVSDGEGQWWWLDVALGGVVLGVAVMGGGLVAGGGSSAAMQGGRAIVAALSADFACRVVFSCILYGALWLASFALNVAL